MPSGEAPALKRKRSLVFGLVGVVLVGGIATLIAVTSSGSKPIVKPVADAQLAMVADAPELPADTGSPDELVDAATTGSAGKPDEFVNVAGVIPDAVIDLRYATNNNFTGSVLYPVATCKLRRAVADRLAKAADTLRKQERRLLLWDCYRPTSIQLALWKKVPDPRYVADPKIGSNHSRGGAVDLAVVDKAGKPVPLPTEFDDFSEAAHRDRIPTGPTGANARMLADAMTGAGFTTIPHEWWHFDAPDSTRYPLSDEPLGPKPKPD
jgi:D-alanyl-D-alanine dipeptidase